MTHHLRRLLEAVEITFCKLNRIQFSAPWNRGISGC